MRRRPPSPEHAEAVSRRLATLSAELASVRGDPVAGHQHTRIRPEPEPVPAPVPAPGPGPWVDPDRGAAAQVSTIPVPGRHASRRLLDRVRLTSGHLAVVAVLVALGVGVAAWLVIRGQAEPVPVHPLSPVAEPLADLPTDGSPGPDGSVVLDAPGAPGATSTGGVASGGATTPAGGDVTVDVAGKVRRPGIAVLPPGSRVVDALEAAGGARRGVDLTSLNLARPLVDGEQVLVGTAAPAGVPATVGEPGATAGGALVNLNTADPITLETLPGVGPVTAGAIIAWRDEHGSFSAVEELLEVDGIGDATLAQIAPHVTI